MTLLRQTVLIVSISALLFAWFMVTTPPPSAHADSRVSVPVQRYSHPVLVKGHREVTMFQTARCSGEPDVVLPGDRTENIRSIWFEARGVWRMNGQRHLVKHGRCVTLPYGQPSLVKVRQVR